MNRLAGIALSTQLLRDDAPLPTEVVSTIWPLLDRGVADLLGHLERSVDPQWVANAQKRLGRLDELAERLSHWSGLGIRPCLLGDDDYPARWIDALGAKAPFVVFVSGSLELCSGTLVGVSGSRDVSQEGALFAASLGHFAADADLGIVSGGARGADLYGAEACHARGGRAVIVSTQLARTVREIGADGRRCFLSPFAPDAAFSAGNAMARNKLVYAMAALTIVVQSDIASGGTWAGATEAISKSYGRVAAWTGGGAGCRQLLERGAEAISSAADLARMLEKRAPKSLFD